MLIKRKIEDLVKKSLFKGKIIIIYGARQVGKTTLVKEIERSYSDNSSYFNCDERDVREALTNKTSTELKQFIGDKKLVIIDEAQRVENIGLTLKLLADNFSDMQIIATGSSSFDLSNKISEPLTGRKNEFYLYPFSLEELGQIYSDLELDRLLENRMIFGMYPEIVKDQKNASKKLKSISQSYAYKDILAYQNIKNPEILEKLLQALALQLGSEVSYNELASTVGIDKNTVSSYIRILEQAFIIFRLKPFRKNLRVELRKLRKVYFYDNGMRNALINNLNPLHLRQDVGALWENFMLSERVKYNSWQEVFKNTYFWRTKKQEIDYLEEEAGKLEAFEFKWQSDKLKIPKAFAEAYSQTPVTLITRKNYQEFLGI